MEIFWNATHIYLALFFTRLMAARVQYALILFMLNSYPPVQKVSSTVICTLSSTTKILWLDGGVERFCFPPSVITDLWKFMQILDFAVFARPEFDVPIFCANFFSTATINIIVL